MFNWLVELWNKFCEVLLAVLPQSPFAPYINKIGNLEYLGWLNWFLPVKACLIIFNSWLLAVAVYYAWTVVARWLKIIS